MGQEQDGRLGGSEAITDEPVVALLVQETDASPGFRAAPGTDFVVTAILCYAGLSSLSEMPCTKL